MSDEQLFLVFAKGSILSILQHLGHLNGTTLLIERDYCMSNDSLRLLLTTNNLIFLLGLDVTATPSLESANSPTRILPLNDGDGRATVLEEHERSPSGTHVNEEDTNNDAFVRSSRPLIKHLPTSKPIGLYIHNFIIFIVICSSNTESEREAPISEKPAIPNQESTSAVALITEFGIICFN